MLHILMFPLIGFINNMEGPSVQVTCANVEEFIDFYGFRPYDFDGDDDVDLADFAVFQRGFDGEKFEVPVHTDE